MFQTTRRRLALWYAGITALLLILFASVVYFYVRTTLVERVDDTLNHVVEVVQRSLVVEQVPGAESVDTAILTPPLFQVNVEDSFRNNSDTVDDDHIDLEWFDGQGNLVWSTLEQPTHIPLHVNPYGETVRLSSDQFLRQVTKRVQIGRNVLGYLRVSHPWFEVTAPSQKLMVDLATGIVVIVATVAGIGWFLSGLAMEPVQNSYQKLKQFTADASHELRNPIAVIQTNVQVALADPEPDAQFQHNQLQVIERITRRLGKMVDDLLFLARQDSGIVQLEVNPISLGGLLVEVISDQAAIAAEHGITLTFTSHEASDLTEQNSQASPVYFVQGDRDQLTRLFTNLISNAIQYTPEQGKVAIALSTSQSSPNSLSKSLPSSRLDSRPRRKDRTKDWATVHVTDSGVGIAEDEIPYIFDRFYRVDRARSVSRSSNGTVTSPPKNSGSGLGLSIVKTIVDNHDGYIDVKSSVHQGTTFTVALPLVYPSIAETNA
ncbi:MAG: HAMP domain-containing sensor histidine kinase [Leptolyngbyaceae bacterium]|nr:HAMP domain-containing sensor histidine kinase [Leptolyngbyaceae bacterium]